MVMRENNKIIDFFGSVIKDQRMTPAHLSLYVALFQLWSINEYVNPFLICRKDVMQLSKIKSFATYHKCITEMHEAGFIVYSPSYNSYVGSSIEIVDFEIEDFSKKRNAPEQKRLSCGEICFSEPVLYEVELYFEERNILTGKAGEFYSLYQAKNWILSNNKPMKCWKSAARSWISKMINSKQK